jgi:hypothetical protein
MARARPMPVLAPVTKATPSSVLGKRMMNDSSA